MQTLYYLSAIHVCFSTVQASGLSGHAASHWPRTQVKFLTTLKSVPPQFICVEVMCLKVFNSQPSLGYPLSSKSNMVSVNNSKTNKEEYK